MREFFKVVTGHLVPKHENSYRPHLLRKPWLLFFLTIVLTAESVFVTSLLAGQSAYQMLSAVLPGEVIALTNAERTADGEGTLTENSLLALAAQQKAEDMASKGYFSHVSPDGKEPWAWIREAGYSYHYAGENLAVRFDVSADVVRAWMASPTHRANIVKPIYTEIGIGVAEGMYNGAPATFVVQYFGTPQDEPVVAVAETKEVPKEQELVNRGEESVAGVETQATPHAVVATATVPKTPVAAESAEQVVSEESSRAGAETFLRASQASTNSASWILIIIASFLAVLTALAVFIHIEIQPAEMVAGGTLVAAIAAFLWVLNGASIPGYMIESAQTASLAEAKPSILVGTAISTELLGG